MTGAPLLSHSLQIERLPRGGYVVVEPNRVGPGYPPCFLAAFSDMAGVLKFIEANMYPSAAEKEPSK